MNIFLEASNNAAFRDMVHQYCENHGWDSNLNHFDVSDITDLSHLFQYKNFTGDISDWDVSKVTSMRGLKQYLKNLFKSIHVMIVPRSIFIVRLSINKGV